MSNDNFCCVIGLDIGTTSISAAVVDIDKKTVSKSYTVPYNHKINSLDSDFSESDADKIYNTAKELLDKALAESSGVRSIGMTGQMHGIVYVDDCGNAVSPLINWQDKRGDKLCDDSVTYCHKITSITGEPIYTGYGFSTVYYDSVNNLIPQTAVSFCSIMDYVAMKLTARNAPLVHSSVANSFGLFDLASSSFKTEAVSKLSLNIPQLPATTDGYDICGHYSEVPVSVAIGDNQASFLGSVKNIDSDVLVNIGTGSQISAVTDSLSCDKDTEIRPLVKGKFIKCGSSLCGGSAYALLEKFFRGYTVAASLGGGSQYDVLNAIAVEAYNNGKTPLNVKTLFNGKRSDPFVTGSVTGITSENFTPGNLALGFIHGICNELYEYFIADLVGKNRVVASGNAIQKMPVFRKVIGDMFSLPVAVSAVSEEASVGTALFSAVSAGILNDVYNFSDFINYN